MKLQITLTICFILLLITGDAKTQVAQQWVNRLPSNTSDYSYYNSMAVDRSGNVYIAANTNTAGTLLDITTVKYSSSGQQLWTSVYNGPGNTDDIYPSIGIDGEGNVYVAGSSATSAALFSFPVIKYNSSGIEQWVVILPGGIGFDFYVDNMAVDASGNIHITVQSSGGSCTTRKLNSSGQQQWVSYSSNFLQQLKIDLSGNAYVLAIIFSSSHTSSIITKYNSSGTLQWSSDYIAPGNGNYSPTGLAIDLAENVYITGRSTDSAFEHVDWLTIKYNSSGQQQWVTMYDRNGEDDGSTSIATDNSGNVYVTGGSTSSGIVQSTTLKYNSSGQQQWEAFYLPSTSYSVSIICDVPGNVYVTGGAGTISDFLTIKYNPSGQQMWSVLHNGPGNVSDDASLIALDSINNVYVSGISRNEGFGIEYPTIKYSQLTGITQNYNSVAEEFSLFQNYPNPFNPSTVINYNLQMTSFVQLKVFDNLGKEVTTLINQKQNAGNYSVDFDGSNLPNGFYFYKLTVGDFSDIKKMVLIK